MSEASALADKRRQQFEQNCEEYYTSLMRYLLFLTRNLIKSEEIAQTTFLRFLSHMDRVQWKQDVKHVKAYLIMTARRLYIDMQKNVGEVELVSYDDELNEQVQEALQRKAKECDDTVARIEDSIYYKELYQSLPLNILLAGMTEYEKSILYMNAVDEMSPEEIAPVVDRSPAQVRYDLQKIHSRLAYRVRKFIEENGGDSPL